MHGIIEIVVGGGFYIRHDLMSDKGQKWILPLHAWNEYEIPNDLQKNVLYQPVMHGIFEIVVDGGTISTNGWPEFVIFVLPKNGFIKRTQTSCWVSLHFDRYRTGLIIIFNG